MVELDPRAIDRLRRMGGDKLLMQMIELFVTHGPERVRSARAAMSTGDTEALRRAVHSLKSSAGNLGANHLMELAATVESLTAEKENPTLPETFEMLEAELAGVLLTLESMRGELNA